MFLMSNPSRMTFDLAGQLKVKVDSMVMSCALLPMVMAAFACGAVYDSHGAQAAVDCPCDNWREEHPEWIWCDDFEDSRAMKDKYFEYGDDGGDFIPMNGVGVGGSRGMRVIFQKGEVGAGGFKKSFGRTPSNYIGRHAERSDEDFQEIYWRMWVRNQTGWIGGGAAKLTRATVMASEGWAQGMIAHLWSGGARDAYLLIDPASGITTNGRLVSTRYNDFENLRWLGNQRGRIPLFDANHVGQWYCIEAHAKLNRPDASDGVFEYWINDQLQTRKERMNWHGDWNAQPERYMINAVFFENYWNAGSPVTQERYFDNIVISTSRIGCGCEGVDVDLDEIPDDREKEVSAYEIGVDDRLVDSDLDGLSNSAEYKAGTDPQDPESVLEISQTLWIDGQLHVSFSGTGNRQYALERTIQIKEPEWVEVTTAVDQCNSPTRHVPLPITTDQQSFYRVVLK